MSIRNTYKNLPDDKGFFGNFGGRYVAETLMPLLLEVESEYEKAKKSKIFKNQLNYYFKNCNYSLYYESY